MRAFQANSSSAGWPELVRGTNSSKIEGAGRDDFAAARSAWRTFRGGVALGKPAASQVEQEEQEARIFADLCEDWDRRTSFINALKLHVAALGRYRSSLSVYASGIPGRGRWSGSAAGNTALRPGTSGPARRPRPKLVLADDHPVIVEGVRDLLGKDFEIAAVAADGSELLEIAGRERPDIIVLDISMPNRSGLDVAGELKKILPRTKLIFLTMHADPTVLKAAFQAGASGYVVKSVSIAELREAIEAVMQGRRFVSPFLPQEVLDRLLQERERLELSPRQRQVLQLLATGYTSERIAKTLGISRKTAEFHRMRLMENLGLRTVAELTSYAIRHGLLPK
jgi:DNA-binding NarL/FixJ family response regulator